MFFYQAGSLIYVHVSSEGAIQSCQQIKAKDFIVKTEDMRRNKKGKRVYLNEVQIQDLLKPLNTFFESFVEISRIKVVDE